MFLCETCGATDPRRCRCHRPIVCQECRSSYEGKGGYHSYLYCELIKLGHRDPEAYLASYGFVREKVSA